MISLEQVRQLDLRVKKAVAAVRSLSLDNADLKRQISDLEAQLGTLRREASERKADDDQLEVSLQGVLDVLEEIDGEPAGVSLDVSADPPEQIRETAVEAAPGENPIPEKEDLPVFPGSAETVPDESEAPEPETYEEEPDLPLLSEENSENSGEFSFEDGPAISPEDDGGDDSQEPIVVESETDEDVPDEEIFEDKKPDGAPESPEDIQLDDVEEDSPESDNKFQSEFDIF